MRSKLCEDGKNRILAKVVVPMGLKEITSYALANPLFHGNEDAMNVFENQNKRELFNIAKESVALRGDNLELADQIATENWTPRQISRAAEHVKRLFPEVD
jgi:hypothetical protein